MGNGNGGRLLPVAVAQARHEWASNAQTTFTATPRLCDSSNAAHGVEGPRVRRDREHPGLHRPALPASPTLDPQAVDGYRVKGPLSSLLQKDHVSDSALNSHPAHCGHADDEVHCAVV